MAVKWECDVVAQLAVCCSGRSGALLPVFDIMQAASDSLGCEDTHQIADSAYNSFPIGMKDHLQGHLHPE